MIKIMQDVHVNLNPGLSWQKQQFNKKRTHFTRWLDSYLRKKLVKCYISSIALYCAEIWKHWKVAQE